jgi:hypothetical protein
MIKKLSNKKLLEKIEIIETCLMGWDIDYQKRFVNKDFVESAFPSDGKEYIGGFHFEIREMDILDQFSDTKFVEELFTDLGFEFQYEITGIGGMCDQVGIEITVLESYIFIDDATGLSKGWDYLSYKNIEEKKVG